MSDHKIGNDALQRTFGIEIEMCNFDKDKVQLPAGFEWSKDEQIVNTDATISRKYGGEVNTPPLRLCQHDRSRFHNVYEQLVGAGGRLKWSIDTHVHIYAGDLELEQLKNVFYLLYHCYPFVKEYCHIPDWDEKVFNAKPIVTQSHYERVKAASTFKELENAFANQSKKGYLRLAFNIASYFVRKTIEFRCFNASQNVDLIDNCVIACYRMFYWSISHTEEDMKAISSYEEFRDTLKLRRETPPIITPMIFQGNPYNAEGCFMAEYIGFNSKKAKALVEQGITELALAGGSTFDYELALWRKVKVKIYNNNEYRHILWLIANDKLKVEYNEKLDWLQPFINNSVQRQMAVAIYATTKVRKVIHASTEYDKVMLNAYKAKAYDSIIAIEEKCKELISMLTSVEYINGNLHDALKSEKVVFYQFAENKNSKSAYNALSQNSDISINIKREPVDYYELVESIPSGVRFLMFSESPYLSNMHKLSVIDFGGPKSDGIFLYSNVDSEKKEANTGYKSESDSEVHINIPPADLSITDAKKLRIERVYSSQLHSMQKRFVKKVDQATQCLFCFAVMYDDYCLGGFGFDLPRGNNADIWQLTDFCTNNDVPRLSKFILLCALSNDTQRSISRSLNRLVTTAETYVYTRNPVSMKYRGVYDKAKDLCTDGRLVYMGTLGKYGSKENIINQYQKFLKK